MIIINDRYLAICDEEEGVRLIGLNVIKRIEIKVDEDQPEANQIMKMLDFIRNDFDEHAGESTE